MNKKQTIAFTLFSLFCAVATAAGIQSANGIETKSTTSQDDKSPRQVTPARPAGLPGPEFDIAKATSLLWEPAGATNEIRVKEGFEYVKPRDDGADNEERWVMVSPAQSYTEAGRENRLLVVRSAQDEDMGRRPSTCHACKASMSLFVFEKNGDSWRLTQKGWDVAFGGSFGRMGDGKLVQIGPERWGVMFEDSYSQMGSGWSGVGLIGITDREIVNLLKKGIALSEGNGGNCGRGSAGPDGTYWVCYGYKGKLSFVPGKNASYYDIEVRTNGTELNEQNETFQTVDKVDRYEIRDGEYVRVGTDAKPVKVLGSAHRRLK